MGRRRRGQRHQEAAQAEDQALGSPVRSGQGAGGARGHVIRVYMARCGSSQDEEVQRKKAGGRPLLGSKGGNWRSLQMQVGAEAVGAGACKHDIVSFNSDSWVSSPARLQTCFKICSSKQGAAD